MKNEKNNSLGKKIAVGAGIVAIAAAAAGTYFLYGSKNAKKNRKQVKAWSLKAKGEILEQLENLSEISKPVYHKIVQEVTDKYKAIKNLDKKDLDEFTKELKGHWEDISKQIGIYHKKNKK
ncbi:MAG: hypothetical protein UR31_C0015G0013 [Parcubacteria group bacterium GW2011_GWA2_33_14]|uniref:Transmembrane(S)protein n=1 Tax=Candidatus Staskawiczbacteria bacterium RIFCSPHIGHO2_02_FULL_33_16 TaxID=1802204 RepID=A0A1G2HY49_9BACT|nr:MAG: hypothetical protein UR31_C0015G0013 [Parcubacteria group bacterium GW2011_GWA2_33_14]OGZ67120.1 MAG: hypothetical protein A3D34_02495 [Candidatus Staskawiczbacteria bacterium RIFCSPHIGHO2_02_FULL_33_16]OGZ70950.1 MAG: hypothetical protein A2980_02995 [Candidatus Staskawiczbacteria bacterium RIFCSPLOWO2_01_FULL_33_13]